MQRPRGGSAQTTNGWGVPGVQRAQRAEAAEQGGGAGPAPKPPEDFKLGILNWILSCT